MARHFESGDAWETTALVCPNCGWTGTFNQGDVEFYEALMDSSCPKCPWPDDPILAIVTYASTHSRRGRTWPLSQPLSASHDATDL